MQNVKDKTKKRHLRLIKPSKDCRSQMVVSSSATAAAVLVVGGAASGGKGTSREGVGVAL
jgi:hypothetical protein